MNSNEIHMLNHFVKLYSLVSSVISWLHKLDGLKDRPTMVRIALEPLF